MSIRENPFETYFKVANRDLMPFAGGMIELINGVAHFTSLNGETYSFDVNTPPWQVAAAQPDIKKEWLDNWSFDPAYLEPPDGTTSPPDPTDPPDTTGFLDSFNSLFSQGNVAPFDWAGGTIGVTDGIATYTDPDGETVSFDQNTSPWDIAQQSPEIIQQWASNWPDGTLAQFAPPEDGQTFEESFANFFEQGTVAPMSWGAGTISLSNGVATYINSDGESTSWTENDNPWTIAQSEPEIADKWDFRWGDTALDEFRPSQTTFLGVDVSNMGNQSQSQSEGGSENTSQSGINWDSDFMQSLLPELQGSFQDISSQVDEWADVGNQMYQNQVNTSLNTQLPEVLESLNQRNILNSTVASDTISKTAGDIIQGGADKQFETGMNAAQMKMGIPDILRNIATLGQESGSGGTSWNTASSSSENELAGLQMLADIYGNLSS